MTIVRASEGLYAPTPHEPSVEDAPIPDVWTPEHVARRLIEAFRIDRRLPRVASPKAPGSAHPQMEYSDEEKAEWERIDFDPSRTHPTPAEITVMEETFGWLRWLTDEAVNRAVRAWASWRADVEAEEESAENQKRDPRPVASAWAKTGIPRRTLFHRRSIGLDSLVSSLEGAK